MSQTHSHNMQEAQKQYPPGHKPMSNRTHNITDWITDNPMLPNTKIVNVMSIDIRGGTYRPSNFPPQEFQKRNYGQQTTSYMHT